MTSGSSQNLALRQQAPCAHPTDSSELMRRRGSRIDYTAQMVVMGLSTCNDTTSNGRYIPFPRPYSQAPLAILPSPVRRRGSALRPVRSGTTGGAGELQGVRSED